MQIIIKDLAGRPMVLDVEYSDTIDLVKTKIEGKGGIPPSQQILIYRGLHMKNKLTVLHYGIKEEEVVHLNLRLRGSGQRLPPSDIRTCLTNPIGSITVCILFQYPETRTFIITISEPYKVDSLRGMIQTEGRITIDYQVLSYEGVGLKEFDTLLDHDFQDYDTIVVLPKDRWRGRRVLAQMRPEKHVAVEEEPNVEETVTSNDFDVIMMGNTGRRSDTETAIGVPAETALETSPALPPTKVQASIYPDSATDNKEASPTVALGMKIFIKTLTGRRLTLEVEDTDDIADVQLLITAKLRIPISQQALLYAGKRLERGTKLKDHNIIEFSTFHLALVLRGGGPTLLEHPKLIHLRNPLETIKVTIQTPTEVFEYRVGKPYSVDSLMGMIQTGQGIAMNRQTLIFENQILKEFDTLDDVLRHSAGIIALIVEPGSLEIMGTKCMRVLRNFHERARKEESLKLWDSGNMRENNVSRHPGTELAAAPLPVIVQGTPTTSKSLPPIPEQDILYVQPMSHHTEEVSPAVIIPEAGQMRNRTKNSLIHNDLGRQSLGNVGRQPKKELVAAFVPVAVQMAPTTSKPLPQIPNQDILGVGPTSRHREKASPVVVLPEAQQWRKRTKTNRWFGCVKMSLFGGRVVG